MSSPERDLAGCLTIFPVANSLISIDGGNVRANDDRLSDAYREDDEVGLRRSRVEAIEPLNRGGCCVWRVPRPVREAWRQILLRRTQRGGDGLERRQLVEMRVPAKLR